MGIDTTKDVNVGGFTSGQKTFLDFTGMPSCFRLFADRQGRHESRTVRTHALGSKRPYLTARWGNNEIKSPSELARVKSCAYWLGSNKEQRMSLATKVMAIVEQRPGVSDRALSQLIFNTPHRSTQINGECHYLQNLGRCTKKDWR